MSDIKEIDIRVWMVQFKKMVYPGLCWFGSSLIEKWPDPKWQDIDKVMLYTGLKDRKGVRIFEGDIIDVAPHMRRSDYVKRLGKNPYYHEVKYNGFGLDPFDYETHDEPEKYEVVGNIYENPELLEL